MEERLNKSKIEYILFHLNQHFEISNLKKYFWFSQFDEIVKEPYIKFNSSNKKINKAFRINDLPVLFPLSEVKFFYRFDKENNLIFTHDLLKTAFYLLSGYQEFMPFKGDHLGRFTYDESIQKELNIAVNPIVNEYFEIIKKAIKEFCERHNRDFKSKSFSGENDFSFLLTHDVDRVDKWTFMEVKRRLKMLIRSGFTKHWKYLFEAIINFNSRENPYWNFEWMKSLEQKLGVNSIWFFLPQGHKQIDAYYSFNESRIQNLAKYFQDYGDEIALHGTFISREDFNTMQSNFEEVKKLSGKPVSASRQHWLSFKYPTTFQIIEKLGLKNDSSWGFAEHCGWRNSYCLPFRPYDLENDRIMDIWELPLNAMDVTFFQYMDLSLSEAKQAFEEMIYTCKKYNGLFVLLWHNSFFEETVYPGLVGFYKEILEMILENNPMRFNGTQDF